MRGCKDDGGSSMIIVAKLLNKVAKFKNTLDLRKLQNADSHERASQHELFSCPGHSTPGGTELRRLNGKKNPAPSRNKIPHLACS